MTVDEIKALIASDESRTLELKKTTGELKDGMHSACAFLNTEGGWLIFGVIPKSLKIVGQEVTDSTRREIAQALAGLEPMVDVRVEYVDVPEHSGNKIIVMYFDRWFVGDKPFTYHGRPYYRVESTTRLMPRDIYDERVRAHKPKLHTWECITADDLTIGDLNEELIRGCVRLGVERGRMPETAMNEPIRETLSKWKLLKNGMPINAAAVLFSKKIDEYPQLAMRMARFVGTDKNEFIDNKRVEGNFFELLDAGMAFLFKHLNLSGKITNHSLMREEHLEVPYVALRETLINALSHRQWERYNLLISIAVYDDRIEIANPGALPSQLTVDNLKESHESFPYNETMAKVLYYSTYLENWGSGVMRIVQACRAQNLPDPIWHDNAGFITVTFQRPPKHPLSTPQVPPKLSGTETTSKQTSDSHQVPPKYPLSIPQMVLLIENMSDSFMPLKEMAELCGIKNLKYFRENFVVPALLEGVLERMYPDQPKHPKQKYRLTGGAKKWKATKKP